MLPVQALLVGLGITAVLGFAVVWYLKPHLKAILVDLCGNDARANFWLAFTNITLILVPVIFAMQFDSEGSPGTPIAFQFVGQLKWALIGLVASVVAVGLVLKSFIPTGSHSGTTSSHES